MSDVSQNTEIFMDDEIDLKELFAALWDGKPIISVITGIAAAISVIVALSLPNIYTASALLAPAENSGGGLSGLMKQYGGLASRAGVSLPGGEEGSRARLGMELMKSDASYKIQKLVFNYKGTPMFARRFEAGSHPAPPSPPAPSIPCLTLLSLLPTGSARRSRGSTASAIFGSSSTPSPTARRSCCRS